MANGTGNGGPTGPMKWVSMVTGAISTGIINAGLVYGGSGFILPGETLQMLPPGVLKNLALMSGVLGACQYITAFIQNPNKPPAIPSLPVPGGPK